MVKLKSFYESDSDNIPLTQGLYAFYLNAISPSKIGLIGNSDFSDFQLERAKSLLISRVSKINRFYRNNILAGTLTKIEANSTIQERYFVQACENPSLHLIEKIKNIPLPDVFSFVLLASSMPLLTQPIYVGITKKQTLFDRYNQHKRDFFSDNDENCFGCRLRASGFDWDDVVFACTEFRVSEGNMNTLFLLEQYFLTISKPILSMK